MRRLQLDVRSGATTEALLGAFVGAGASLARIERHLSAIGPGAVPIAVRQASNGTAIRLHAPPGAAPLHVWGSQRPRVAMLALDEGIVATTLAVLEALARARAAVHGIAVDDVEADPFTGLDELANAVALASALASLEVTTVTTRAIGVGTGTLRTLEGPVRMPGPVVAELLTGRQLRRIDVGAELVDPVGAAFLAGATTESSIATQRVAGAVPGRGRGVVSTRSGSTGVVVALAV